MLTEKSVIELLSNSEVTVYHYIKEKCESNDGALKQSMSAIGKSLGVSEATVHRAVRKLKKQGVIGIVPSSEKAESNEIIYYGLPDADKQVGDIFKMIGELSSSANRFEAILKTKDDIIDQLKRDKEDLYEKIDFLEQQAKNGSGFDQSKIISSQPLGDGTTAYIVKN